MTSMIPRKTLQLSRVDSAPVYVKGRATPSSRTDSEFKASVQPLKTNEMLTLPEGRREREAFRLYTNFELKTVDETGELNADWVTYNGKVYEVISSQPWQNTLVNHYRVIISLRSP